MTLYHGDNKPDFHLTEEQRQLVFDDMREKGILLLEFLGICKKHMTDDQIMELEFVRYIMLHAGGLHERTIKGTKYFTCIVDLSADGIKPMRFIYGGKGWTLAPVDMPIAGCVGSKQK